MLNNFSHVMMTALTFTAMLVKSTETSSGKNYGGFITFFVVICLGVVLYFAFREKDPVDKIMTNVKGFIASKRKTTQAPVEDDTATVIGTFFPPEISVKQINSNNKVIHEIQIDNNDLIKHTAISRPGSTTNGKMLIADPTDPRRPLSAGTDAFELYKDENGNLVGLVTNDHITVRVRYSGKEVAVIPYDVEFDIEENMFIVCGYQVLYITFPHLVNYSGFGAVDTSAAYGSGTTKNFADASYNAVNANGGVAKPQPRRRISSKDIQTK